jgi:intron-binding protein aquarius
MTSVTTFSFVARRLLLAFVIHAFQSLDIPFVKKELAPLAQIGIWHGLSSDERREREFEKHPPLRKIWRGSQKRFEAGDEATKQRLRFEQSWLYSLIIDFISILHTPGHKSDRNHRSYSTLIVAAVLLYAERLTELLIDLQSQLPTRKYTNALIIDLNVLVAVRLSSLFNAPANQLFRDLVFQLEHYVYFAVNGYTSAPLSDAEMHKTHCAELARLQRISIADFKDKLTVLALSNFAAIDTREELLELLSGLTDEELVSLCQKVDLRTSYPEGTKVTVDKTFLLEILVQTYQRRESFVEQARNLTIYPTEVPPNLTSP